MNKAQLPLSDQMVELVARRFRMLGEPQRLRILQTLENGERTVGEIVESLAANQSNISKHLQSLYDAGIVGRRREGNSIYYSIGDPVVLTLCELVCQSATADARTKLAELAPVKAAPRAKR
ncbi:MAG TPA: transcriptional regulator [Solibacterales bacterium]|nr:transcriptional regulator [Bryobacterales bacterium]